MSEGRTLRRQEARMCELHGRLDARRAELEQTALARISAIADPAAAPDPAYASGLRAALADGLDYGLAAIAGPKGEPDPVPVALLAQARLSARNGISLDVVLRRYAAGHTLLADGLLEEAAALGLGAAELKAALRALSVRYERIVATVSEEYEREAASRPCTPDERRAKRIESLLGGELLDASDLAYDLDAYHIGLIAKGPAVGQAIRKLASLLDRRSLTLQRDGEIVWAWLGGRRPFEQEDLDRSLGASWPPQLCLALGEPGKGIGGWRLTHQQARAALPIALRSPDPFVRYANVALLASIHRDDLLVSSLQEIYLKPLDAERDGGEMLRETLRAYFATGRNVSSAAAVLGLSRHTVASRLRLIEGRLGRPLGAHAAEIEAALGLDLFLHPV